VANKKKIALVLSGGSSLGAYIAGALDELLFALRHTDEFEIDVVVGASAGAVGSALIAHGLLYRAGETQLHKVWVDQFDMADLLDPGENSDPRQVSLLSDKLLLAIERQARAWSQADEPVRRAPFCAESLILGFALSNSTALAYQERIAQPTGGGTEPFVQRHYAEQESFWLDPAVLPTNEKFWERICRVAQGSAAIPFVFPLVQLTGRDPARTTLNASQRALHFLQAPAAASLSKPQDFYYYDGGTYNNLPLDLCAYHIHQTLGCSPNDPDRFVYVVNPWRQTVESTASPGRPPRLLEYARLLYSGLRTEAGTIHFDETPTAGATLSGGAGAARYAQRLPVAPPPTDEARAEAFSGAELPPVELLGQFALVMPREEQRVSPIRGYLLGALGAFVDRRFREYDYWRGAADASEVINKRLGIVYSRPDPSFYHPENNDSLYGRVDLSKYEALDRIPSSRRPNQSVRQVFETALIRRIDALVPRVVHELDLKLLENPLAAAALEKFVRDEVYDKLPQIWSNEIEFG
jgi:predicted acylesterase/phospholipase RssA